MSHKLVSIIIPMYNSEKTLENTFETLIIQTYQDIEILLIDDGSTDRTAEIALSFAQKYSNVYYHHKENGGVASARNLGLKKAAGKLIALCDHDELWLPQKLEKQVPLFDDPETGLVYSGHNVKHIKNGKENVMNNGRRIYYEGDCFHKILQFNFIPTNTVVIREKCFEKVGDFYSGKEMHGTDDRHMWIRIARYYKIRAVKEVLITHVIHGDNWSLNENRMLNSAIACLDDISKQFPAKSSKDVIALKKGYFNTYLHYGLNLFYKKDYKNARYCFKQTLRRKPFHLKSLMYYLSGFLPQNMIDFIRNIKSRFY
ncbi:glycosyltransferase [candidate division KSB1 bacterium]|nr:glycosyltransferase [candidate division KSB1 bacterium]